MELSNSSECRWDFSWQGVKIWTASGPVEHSVRCVKEFIDAGVDHAAIRPIGEDLNAQFCIYLEEILPALNAANESQVVTRLLPYSDV